MEIEIETYQKMLDVIKKAIWGIGTVTADRSTFDEMQRHAIAALAAPVLDELSLSSELFKIWDKVIVQQVIQHYRFLDFQLSLPITVPYVILKGTTAAQYYPYPEYRAFGDIDIMTSHKDFEIACDMLINNGYTEVSSEHEKYTRHREFFKGNIEIELHSYYAYRNIVEEAKQLDDLIIQNIDASHVLPDIINGLTLIEHINFHMETGLGLRQIIDWMMFVDKCLPDEKWPMFQKLAQQSGLEKLAMIVTRMCELYLGLSKHQWCAEADPTVCEQLMNYILSCGNFGNKEDKTTKASIRFLTNTYTLKGNIQYLQKQGLLNWKASQTFLFLRPFAWVHQAKRYLVKGILRKDSFNKLKAEYEISKHRNQLFDSLGVTREQRGLIVYQDKEYSRRKW